MFLLRSPVFQRVVAVPNIIRPCTRNSLPVLGREAIRLSSKSSCCAYGTVVAAKNTAPLLKKVNDQGVDEGLKKVQILFPEPASTLHMISQLASPVLNGKALIKVSYMAKKEGFECTITINWPEVQVFSGLGRRKKLAWKEASWKSLDWLLINGHIRTNGEPIFASEELLEEINFPTVSLSQEALDAINNVVEMYRKDVAPVMQTFHGYETKMVTSDETVHPLFGQTYCGGTPPQSIVEEYNRILQSKRRKSPPLTSSLPIEAYRNDLVRIVEDNRVVIVKGETGCGKSTQVPQFILDDKILNGVGAECNIVVTQPRRITAMSLAQRVADERREKLGETVGYSVRFRAVRPCHPGAVMFLTGGKLAQAFAGNPNLEGISHVILDEAHQRDVQTDILLCLLKQAMRNNPELRVVIMSATLNSHIFETFFSEFGKVAVFSVPGRTYPVVQNFWNDLPKEVRCGDSPNSIDAPLVARTVTWIHKTKPVGSILVFVTGWQDMQEIRECLKDENGLQIIPVHSMLGSNEKAFLPPKKGKRKVILATNIAETSLTFPDVVYVVDCGLLKTSTRDPFKVGGSILKPRRISRASVSQRMGRAGRVQRGESFHLFTRDEFNQMEEFDPPEIWNASLTHVVLTLKMVFPEVQASHIFEAFPEPPEPKSIRETVKLLTDMNFLSQESEKPTPLAYAVSRISAEPLPSSVALIYSSLLRCMPLTLSTVACWETKGALLDTTKVIKKRADIGNILQQYDDTSDSLACGKMLNSYIKQRESDVSVISHLNGVINEAVFKTAVDLHHRLEEQLTSMIKVESGNTSDTIEKDHYSDQFSEALIKGVFLLSNCSLLHRSIDTRLRNVMFDEFNRLTVISPGSVNGGNKKFSSPILLYTRGHSLGKLVLVNDSTVVSPLTFLLFTSKQLTARKCTKRTGLINVTLPRKKRFGVRIPEMYASQILLLRRALQSTLKYFVVAEACQKPDENLALMQNFRSELLNCIRLILVNENEQAER